MHRLEVQAIVENTGNYDEEDIDYILDIYDDVMKHVGFKDERRDKRFIVKFHDIFWYTPYKITETEEFSNLFDEFCKDQYEYIKENANCENINIDRMLTRYGVGNYKAFVVNMPEITDENAIELAMKIYDEVPYEKEKYASDYVYIINALQDLEDNYMEYWIEYLTDYVTEDVIKEMKTKYEKDKEREK